MAKPPPPRAIPPPRRASAVVVPRRVMPRMAAASAATIPAVLIDVLPVSRGRGPAWRIQRRAGPAAWNSRALVAVEVGARRGPAPARPVRPTSLPSRLREQRKEAKGHLPSTPTTPIHATRPALPVPLVCRRHEGGSGQTEKPSGPLLNLPGVSTDERANGQAARGGWTRPIRAPPDTQNRRVMIVVRVL